MPKAISKYTVNARNEYLSLQERITPSKAIRTKYAEVGKRRVAYKPVFKKIVTPTLTLKEHLEIVREFERESAEKALQS